MKKDSDAPGVIVPGRCDEDIRELTMLVITKLPVYRHRWPESLW